MSRPVLIGLVGDSASGRATFARGLASALGTHRATLVNADGYLRHDRDERAVQQLTPLHPAAHHLDVLEQHLAALAIGEPILLPGYDHVTGERLPTKYVEPSTFIIVDGLLAFHTTTLRERFDLRVFLDPSEELRRAWKVRRDAVVRGRPAAEVIAELDQREPDATAYLRPQRRWADAVVHFRAPRVRGPGEGLDALLTLRPAHSLARRALEDLTARRGRGAASVRTAEARGDDGGMIDVVEIDGTIGADEASDIAASLLAGVVTARSRPAEPPGTVDVEGRPIHSHPLAVAQALVAYHLLTDRAAAMRLQDELRRAGGTVSRERPSG